MRLRWPATTARLRAMSRHTDERVRHNGGALVVMCTKEGHPWPRWTASPYGLAGPLQQTAHFKGGHLAGVVYCSREVARQFECGLYSLAELRRELKKSGARAGRAETLRAYRNPSDSNVAPPWRDRRGESVPPFVSS